MVSLALLASLALPAGAQSSRVETLVVGGGCFWCMEAVFQRLKGVLNVESGYAGGTLDNPSYEQVCTGTTGHAEAVRITYDAALITRERLLDWFFQAHDPTTLNRQGADEGTQYRSVIFFTEEDSRQAAQKAIQSAQKLWKAPVVTTVEGLKTFWPAELYHRNYYNLHKNNGYNRAVIQPKLLHLGLEN